MPAARFRPRAEVRRYRRRRDQGLGEESGDHRSDLYFRQPGFRACAAAASGNHVVSMAYSGYLLPPERIRIDPYVIPEYTQWSAYMHANPELKHEHESIAAGWARAARTVAVYEYFINGSWPGMHRLVAPYIAESIRYLKKQGIEMYQMQSITTSPESFCGTSRSMSGKSWRIFTRVHSGP